MFHVFLGPKRFCITQILIRPGANLTAGVGHAGTTYGFQSINHFYAHLNLSLSVTLDCDSCLQKRIIMCNIVAMTLRHRGVSAPELECASPSPHATVDKVDKVAAPPGLFTVF